jgi:hypothetical protein
VDADSASSAVAAGSCVDEASGTVGSCEADISDMPGGEVGGEEAAEEETCEADEEGAAREVAEEETCEVAEEETCVVGEAGPCEPAEEETCVVGEEGPCEPAEEETCEVGGTELGRRGEGLRADGAPDTALRSAENGWELPVRRGSGNGR